MDVGSACAIEASHSVPSSPAPLPNVLNLFSFPIVVAHHVQVGSRRYRPMPHRRLSLSFFKTLKCCPSLSHRLKSATPASTSRVKSSNSTSAPNASVCTTLPSARSRCVHLSVAPLPSTILLSAVRSVHRRHRTSRPSPTSPSPTKTFACSTRACRSTPVKSGSRTTVNRASVRAPAANKSNAILRRAINSCPARIPC